MTLVSLAPGLVAAVLLLATVTAQRVNLPPRIVPTDTNGGPGGLRAFAFAAALLVLVIAFLGALMLASLVSGQRRPVSSGTGAAFGVGAIISLVVTLASLGFALTWRCCEFSADVSAKATFAIAAMLTLTYGVGCYLARRAFREWRQIAGGSAA
jgi:hypothetical protein